MLGQPKIILLAVLYSTLVKLFYFPLYSLQAVTVISPLPVRQTGSATGTDHKSS